MKYYLHADLEKCAEFGVNPDKVESMGRKLKKICQEAEDMRCVLFAGTFGGLMIRSYDNTGCNGTVGGNISNNCDGGDGGDE